jgi:hypothetical protein
MLPSGAALQLDPSRRPAPWDLLRNSNLLEKLAVV